MRKHFCDLCGKEINDLHTNDITLYGRVVHPTSGIPGICKPSTGVTVINKDLEICDECFTDLFVEFNEKYRKVYKEDLYNRNKCIWFDNLMKDRESR